MSYDTNSTQGDPNVTPYDNQMPFKAFLRVVPYSGGGRRLAGVRDLQNTARMVENDLVAAGWNIARPVAFTPQFGHETARITVVGFIQRDEIGSEPEDTPNFAPTTDVQVFNSGTVPGEKTGLVTGNVGGSLSWAQDTVAKLDTLVSDIKNALTLDSSVIGEVATIDKIELMGVTYGMGGRSFPI